jgi:hypothetical protein
MPGVTVSLAMDSKNNPRIVYNGGEASDLRYSSWNGSGWYIQVVDSTARVGGDSCLSLDSFDNPHIAYWAFDYSVIMYVTLPPNSLPSNSPTQVETFSTVIEVLLAGIIIILTLIVLLLLRQRKVK